MTNYHAEVTQQLLQINTIKIQPQNPFTWASGWLSPIYCDNRKVLSYPETRTYIYKLFAKLIKEKYPEVDAIAGVATGAIAIGVLVAQELNLPFVYIRSAAKGHGLENLIEGDLKSDQKVVVVEDLVSTGGSSLKAVQALRNFGADVLGMMAIFSYNFPIAAENFKAEGVQLDTLSNYEILIQHALDKGQISDDDYESLKKWRESPATWGK